MNHIALGRIVCNVYKFFMKENKLIKYSVERLMFLPPMDSNNFYGQQTNEFLYNHMDYDKMKKEYKEKCAQP